MKSYSETIQYLYDCLPVFHHIGSNAYKPGLDNTIRLMNALANPFQNYKTIHIAGTNGKGSVSHLIASVLQSAGYKVGLYTSPHLVDFGERIKVNGEMIDQQYAVDFVENNSILFDEIKPSFFEATMAMSFKYFADKEVDIAVIEVGLGGRLDSTNIINPILSIITNISFDHVSFLGDTLEKIAYEKAGIIKMNTSVVIGENQAETRPVFIKKALEMNAPIIFADEFYQIKFEKYIHDKMLVTLNDESKMMLGLNGLYQLKNLATVLASLNQLRKMGVELTESQMFNGIENVVELTGLKGRWQVLNKHPMVIADTGHNLAGISFVVEQLAKQKFNKLHIVIGMVNDKDIQAVLAVLPSHAQYYFTQAQIARALSANELEQKAFIFGLKGNVFLNVDEAIASALKNAHKNDLVFIGGSNFIVGEALNTDFFKE